jgi:hypothetical protein
VIGGVIAIIIGAVCGLAAGLIVEVERESKRYRQPTKVRLCLPLPTARVVTPRPWWRRWGSR